MEAHTENLPGNRAAPRAAVSGELIAILAVGVMLAGLVFTTAGWIRGDTQVLRGDMQVLRGDVQILRDEVRAVHFGLGELRERVVRIETLLEERSADRRG